MFIDLFLGPNNAISDLTFNDNIWREKFETVAAQSGINVDVLKKLIRDEVENKLGSKAFAQEARESSQKNKVAQSQRQNFEDARTFVCGRHEVIKMDLEKTLQKKCDKINREDLLTISEINLEKVDLSALTAKDFSGLVNLEYLVLRTCRIGPFPPDLLSELPALKLFEASNSEVDTIPADFFKKNENIEEIDISNSTISKLPGRLLRNLKRLKRFYADNTMLSRLSDNFFKENLEMEELSLQGTPIKALPLSVATLTSLTALYIGRTKIQSIPLDSFKHLPLIILNMSEIEGFSFDAALLEPLTQLDQLYLAQLGISKLPANFLQNKPELRHIRLSRNNLRSIPLGFFSNSDKLEMIELNHNQFRNIPAAIDREWDKLAYLGLQGNKIDFGLERNARLKKKLKTQYKRNIQFR